MNITDALHASFHGRTFCAYVNTAKCPFFVQAEQLEPYLVLEFQERLPRQSKVERETNRLRMHLASEHGAWVPGTFIDLSELHTQLHHPEHGPSPYHDVTSRAWDPDVVERIRP